MVNILVAPLYGGERQMICRDFGQKLQQPTLPYEMPTFTHNKPPRLCLATCSVGSTASKVQWKLCCSGLLISPCRCK